jgi:hypothetical protein
MTNAYGGRRFALATFGPSGMVADTDGPADWLLRCRWISGGSPKRIGPSLNRWPRRTQLSGLTNQVLGCPIVSGEISQLKSRSRQLRSERSDQLTVAAGPLSVADDDPVAARQVAASMAAWYVSAMGDVYSRSLSKNGYAAEVAAVRAANPRPRLQDGVIPVEAERMLDDFAPYGTSSQMRERLECWDHAVDIVMVGCAPGIPWHMIETTLCAAAP